MEHKKFSNRGNNQFENEKSQSRQTDFEDLFEFDSLVNKRGFEQKGRQNDNMFW